MKRIVKVISLLVILSVLFFVGSFTLLAQSLQEKDVLVVKSLEFIPARGLNNIFTYEKSNGRLMIKNNGKSSINNLKYIIEIKKQDEADWKKLNEGVVGISAERERSFDFSYVFDKAGDYIAHVKLESDGFKKEVVPGEKSITVYKNVDIQPLKFTYVAKDKKKELMVPVEGEFLLALISNGQDASGAFKYRILVDRKPICDDLSVDNLAPNEKKALSVSYRFAENQGGRHLIEAVINPNKKLVELNQDNNRIAKEIIVYFVDAQIEEFKLFVSDKEINLLKDEGTIAISKGTNANFSLKVRNNGNMSIKTITGEIVICGSTIPFTLKGILPRGGTKTFEFSHIFVSNGGCDITVYLDKNNELPESDKSNNKFSVKTNIEVK